MAGYRPQDSQDFLGLHQPDQEHEQHTRIMPPVQDNQTFAIIGAAFRVHQALGCGFLEKVYHDALEVEFRHTKIPYEREKTIAIHYRNVRLGEPYYADFLCYGDVIVELKAIRKLNKIEEAQVLHYLRATHCTRALLINFGQPNLQIIRFVNGYKHTFDEEEVRDLAAQAATKNSLAVPSAVAEQ